MYSVSTIHKPDREAVSGQNKVRKQVEIMLHRPKSTQVVTCFACGRKKGCRRVVLWFVDQAAYDNYCFDHSNDVQTNNQFYE